MAPIPNPVGPERGRRHAQISAAAAPASRGYVPNPSFAPPAAAPAGAEAPPPAPVQIVAMRPIPNPGDLSAAERRRIYGPGRAYRLHRHAAPAHRPLRHRESASGGTPPPTVRPAAKAPARPAPRIAAPAIVAPKPMPAKPMPARPLTPMAMAPKPAARPPAPAAPQTAAPKTAVPMAAVPMAAAKPMLQPPAPTAAQGRLGQLQTAVGGAVARGSTLAVAPEISAGKPGQVSLSLPASLFDTLKAEAAKLGLSKPARKADVKATLSGDGYAVTPSGQQTAALKAGEVARFDWRVAPAAGARGPLKADVDAVLTGQGKPRTLSLASIQSAVAAVATKADKQAGGFKFKLPHLPKFSIPGFGAKAGGEMAGPPPVPAGVAAPAAARAPLLRDRNLRVIGRVSALTQVAVGLAVLAVLILALASRGIAGSRRQAERRRRYRTFQPMAMDGAPADA